jgi:hypothetical protein
MPLSFRWKLLLIAFGNGVATVLYDYFCVNGVRHWRAAKKAHEARNSKVDTLDVPPESANSKSGRYSKADTLNGPKSRQHFLGTPSQHSARATMPAYLNDPTMPVVGRKTTAAAM